MSRVLAVIDQSQRTSRDLLAIGHRGLPTPSDRRSVLDRPIRSHLFPFLSSPFFPFPFIRFRINPLLLLSLNLNSGFPLPTGGRARVLYPPRTRGKLNSFLGFLGNKTPRPLEIPLASRLDLRKPRVTVSDELTASTCAAFAHTSPTYHSLRP